MRGDLIRGLVLTALLPLGGCDWFTTFRYQPKIDTWENMAISPDTNIKYYWPAKSFIGPTWSQREDAGMPLVTRGNPQFSVPITGTALPYFQISNLAMPGVIDSIGVAVTNPTPPSDSSVALGRRYYQVNCAVCHGDDGTGTKNMIVMKYGLGINIVGDGSKARSDGYIYGMIRNGRGLMPSYNRVEEADRWHVVNYVRGLQGKLGKDVEKGPLGYPGQTGTALPGYTTLGPTRPAPFAKPGRATGVDVRSDARAAGTKKGGDQ